MTYPRRAARRCLPTRVRSVADVTGRVRQIELIGPDLSGRSGPAGSHLVVRVPDGAGTARRVYSIWRHDPRSASIFLRVVLHDRGGPGCAWARRVAVGDRVGVEPPRSKITLAGTAAFHLFVGDETGAVPLLALRAALHRTSAGVPVHGVFEAAGAGDEMPGVEAVPPLPWVHRGTGSAVASRVLVRAVQELELPAGVGAAYVAGESDTCRLVQRHLVEQRGWSRHAVHVQQQWAAGRPGFGAGLDA